MSRRQRRTRGRPKGGGSWFTEQGIWPVVNSAGATLPPQNLYLVAAQVIAEWRILKYTPTLSTPGPEILTQVATGVEVLSGHIDVDVFPAPSVGVTDQIQSVVVGLAKVFWDQNVTSWADPDPSDPAQVSRPWLYLQSRGMHMFHSPTNNAIGNGSRMHFRVPIPKIRIEAGEALTIYVYNAVETGGQPISCAFNGRIKIRDLE